MKELGISMGANAGMSLGWRKSVKVEGGMYTFLYPLDVRHPDPPQPPLGSGILIGQTPNRAIGC
jgi:hypothetical protein